jgi:polar amino acid transport system permease protein
VLPQAMRVILPPTGNEFISMLKNTALASTIAFAEIYFVTQDIASVNFDVPQLLIVGSIWYLALTSVAYVGQYFLERRVGQGFSRAEQATMKDRWLSFGTGGKGGGR